MVAMVVIVAVVAAVVVEALGSPHRPLTHTYSSWGQQYQLGDIGGPVVTVQIWVGVVMGSIPPAKLSLAGESNP